MPDDTVLIFHKKGAKLKRIKNMAADSKADVQYCESAKDGKNSIDFQIVAELGVMIGKNQVEYAYIISHDQGYVAPITSLKKKYAKAFKEIDLKDSIEQCLYLPFLMRASNKKELHAAFVKEYGAAFGAMIYNHLKTVYAKSDEPNQTSADKKTSENGK
jgi:hypothetical protein